MLCENVSNAEPKLRIELMHALAERNAKGMVPMLLTETKSKDKEVSNEAFRALGQLAEAKDLPALLKKVAKAKSAEETKEPRDAVVGTARRAADQKAAVASILKAYKGARKAEVKVALLESMDRLAMRMHCR